MITTAVVAEVGAGRVVNALVYVVFASPLVTVVRGGAAVVVMFGRQNPTVLSQNIPMNLSFGDS